MSLTITTVNVNGIRAAVKHRSEANRGLLHWLAACDSDVVLMQEVRAEPEQARESLAPALDDGWHFAMSASVVKGHAGVGVLSRVPITAVRAGFGSDEFDPTGRYLEADIDSSLGAMTVASLYLPKGAAATTAPKDVAKYEEKVRFLDEFGTYLDRLRRRRRHVVVGGDWNIAHGEADIKNWKGNLKSPGFLPHERSWVGALLDGGWNDVARDLAPDDDGPYTWWSWRGKAFDNDSGWRIDYQLANRTLAGRAVKATVDRADAYDLRWSDHAPMTVVYD
ncbi:exodeoxyribonuclease III [Gordonia rhizosphera]|uniref:Exodeoxyribonuclease n=1 Tax=Gordonia rhizosphera NBRC 16068 TaxID=1108045 RepID=K6W803_9ACTN|nr:exodeoxyribonuclease III [Gordonia rhizosphera]GAB88342.1 exodeoxyribonuclease [Gordonia rhizosphera NBRC 16068]